MKGRGRLLRTSCLAKIRHATKEAAEIHSRDIEARFGTELDVYRCTFCGGYHCGRPKRYPEQRPQ
jgi:hypothetical protein